MTINLFRVYGLLGHEKQPIFAACDARPENPYDLVEAELPDGWSIWENDCYERILEDPDGTSYPLVECLHTMRDTPFIAWAYADGRTADISLKWRYANNTVRGLRERRGYTQKFLAQKAGINVRLLQKLELGEINIENITAKNLLSIADALDVEPYALFK